MNIKNIAENGMTRENGGTAWVEDDDGGESYSRHVRIQSLPLTGTITPGAVLEKCP